LVEKDGRQKTKEKGLIFYFMANNYYILNRILSVATTAYTESIH
jgi:hypothetical protein